MSTNRTLLHLQNLPTHRSHSLFVKSAIFERRLCRDPKMTQVGHFWVAKIYGFWVCAEVLPSFFRDFSRAARRTPKKHGFIFWGAPKNPNNMGGFSIRHGRVEKPPILSRVNKTHNGDVLLLKDHIKKIFACYFCSFCKLQR